MTELLTAAQMRAVEQAAIASGEVTGLELMERAGQGVVDAIFAEWPELAPAAGGAGGFTPSADASPPEYFEQSETLARRAVVLCGPGNNGGDGFVVARLLKEVGWDVDVFLYGVAEKLPPDARLNYERCCEQTPVFNIEDDHLFNKTPDVWVDAIFGIGLTRDVPDPVYWALDHIGRLPDAKTVCVDMPSWFASDSGAHFGRGHGLEFNLVVTFAAPKLGHYIGVACDFIRALRVVDIGVDASRVADCVDHMGPKGLGGALQKGVTSNGEHKYSHGHALILSGGVGKGGAARLAARGALRVGAGAVTLAAPPAALIENAAQLNAVMLAKLRDVDALTRLLADARINALCLGPAFGMGQREKALLTAALDWAQLGQGRHLVLDADALTMLSQEPALFAALPTNCVLTPHAGEFARLFPDIAEKLNAPATKGPAYSKVDATREAAKRAGCTVLFKGPDTVIAASDGQCSINASVYERAAPWLATAGSGDVLAGFITGLLARGFTPMQAAETGAWLHTECALAFGPGLIAEDLPEVLPRVLTALIGA